MQIKKEKAPSSELYQKLRAQDTATLTEDLEGIAEKSGELSADEVQRLIATLDVLEEKAPVLPEDYDVEDDLRRFKEKNAPAFQAHKGSEKPGRKRLKASRMLLIAAALVVLLGIVAQAAGFNIIQLVKEWGDEVFMLSAPKSGKMELAEAPYGEFLSLAAAVSAYQIEDDVVPTWIPSDLEIQYANVKLLEDANLIVAYYQSAERSLSIKIMHYGDSIVGDSVFEHSGASEIEYIVNGTAFSISENLEQCRAIWETPSCACIINGNIEESEMEQILNSIFKG